MRFHHGNYVFSRKELWNLDLYLAKIIRDGLKQFKKMERYSYPPEFSNPEDWENALDKMINAFDIIESSTFFEKNSPMMKYLIENPCITEDIINNVTESNSNELKLEDIPKEIEEADKIYRKKTEKIITEGLELFSRYFRHIWD